MKQTVFMYHTLLLLPQVHYFIMTALLFLIKLRSTNYVLESTSLLTVFTPLFYNQFPISVLDVIFIMFNGDII